MLRCKKKKWNQAWVLWCKVKSPQGNCRTGRQQGQTNAMGGVLRLLSVFPYFLRVTQITSVHDKDLHTLNHLGSLKREAF